MNRKECNLKKGHQAGSESRSITRKADQIKIHQWQALCMADNICSICKRASKINMLNK